MYITKTGLRKALSTLEEQGKLKEMRLVFFTLYIGEKTVVVNSPVWETNVSRFWNLLDAISKTKGFADATIKVEYSGGEMLLDYVNEWEVEEDDEVYSVENDTDDR